MDGKDDLKPSYVILALQTTRTNDVSKHDSKFDHCSNCIVIVYYTIVYNTSDCILSSILFLNDKYYPYDNLNFDFEKGRFALGTLHTYVYITNTSIDTDGVCH